MDHPKGPKALGVLLGKAVIEGIVELQYLSEAFVDVEAAEPRRKCSAACFNVLEVRFQICTQKSYRGNSEEGAHDPCNCTNDQLHWTWE